MHDAQLHAGAREHRLDGLGEALQAIHAGDEDVLNATVAQFGHHLQPELGALVLGDPQAEDFLLAGQVDTQRQIDRLHPHGALAHLAVDAVEVDDGIHRIERARLPGLDLIGHRVGHRGDQAG